MNRLLTLMVGIFFVFATSWTGLVMWPFFKIGRLQPVIDEDTKEVYPRPLSGLAEHGRQVYAQNGCYYCHSQQVRPEHTGSDIARGWGARRTVARDYIFEKPVMLGTMRTGPDLANIGRRQPSAQWHHEHNYAPRWRSPGSIMPSFSYLYEVRKIKGEPALNAIHLDPEWVKQNPSYAIPAGYEIVPTYDAEALVAYLLSLDKSYPLPEVPEP